MVPKPWNMALNEGIWDPKPRVIDIKGTSLKFSTPGMASTWRDSLDRGCASKGSRSHYSRTARRSFWPCRRSSSNTGV